MPLSKARMRERKKRDRAVKPKPAIPGLKMDGNKVLGLTNQPVKPSEPSTPPIYSPYEHYEPGDKVLILRGRRMVETVMPEVDADGNAIPVY